MTSGQSPSSPSALKIGGFGLIGVGALAAVIGATGLVSGGSEDTAAPAPPPNSAPLPPLPPQPQPAPAPQPERPDSPPQAQRPPEQPPSPDPQPPAPPAAEPPQQDPGSGQVQQQHVRVRVYNNSTIKGLAHRAAEDFRTAGYDVPEVGNFARGTIPTTTVYYRPGTDEELQARELATVFQAKAEPRFPGAAPDNEPGLVAIITNDYKGFSGGKGGA